MKTQTIRPFMIVTSLALLAAGLGAIAWFLHGHRLLWWFMGGYTLVSLFFLGMKLAFARTLARRIASPPAPRAEDG